ncbi:hypothetical protein [Algoriphagus sp.]|uniref:hypothetical protein n=1 Tax=Algoriphagus sp. TaxID=1872435 RepID=UPI00271A3912|nr:hypothetical protein [Algoriphagus sp.]MDO8967638.1 hypothetical protein [Algoriphagus sp.]MDP3198561.1 hypothetical protein [Algoriphagus sp.]
MLDYILSQPLYIPFIIFNIYLIYKVIRYVLENDQDNNEDDENGGELKNDNPVLDLPPGVTLPVSDKESILKD